ncbi:MAG: sulfotransferase [Proteobacteria bacterium]|nr:sulfotransferase [Pseudomonadota bacterium]
MPDMSQRLFFVIGAPRSGTTLLMRMLNMHPDIYTRPEPHLMTPLAHLGYYAYPDKASYDPFQAHQGARAFVDELPGGEQDYLEALRAYSDTLYGRMLEPTGKRYFLDKTPAYALVLPFLKRLYPDAVFIVLTRHPFAIFSSFAKSFFDDDWAAAEAFNPIVQRYVPAISAFLADPPKRFHHVQYESLVADPETHLRAICAAAEIPYSDELIEYGSKKVEGKGLGDPIGVAQHNRPTTSSVHKWAKQVAGNRDRIAQLEAMVQRLDDEDLERFGTPREALFEPLNGVDEDAAAQAQRKVTKWDRYSVERRALLVLRKNIHQNTLGRTLKKVRFYCDVLLRE